MRTRRRPRTTPTQRKRATATPSSVIAARMRPARARAVAAAAARRRRGPQARGRRPRGDLRPRRRRGIRPLARPRGRLRPRLLRELEGPPQGRGHDRARPDHHPPRRLGRPRGPARPSADGPSGARERLAPAPARRPAPSSHGALGRGGSLPGVLGDPRQVGDQVLQRPQVGGVGAVAEQARAWWRCARRAARRRTGTRPGSRCPSVSGGERGEPPARPAPRSAQIRRPPIVPSSSGGIGLCGRSMWRGTGAGRAKASGGIRSQTATRRSSRSSASSTRKPTARVDAVGAAGEHRGRHLAQRRPVVLGDHAQHQERQQVETEEHGDDRRLGDRRQVRQEMEPDPDHDRGQERPPDLAVGEVDPVRAELAAHEEVRDREAEADEHGHRRRVDPDLRRQQQADARRRWRRPAWSRPRTSRATSPATPSGRASCARARASSAPPRSSGISGAASSNSGGARSTRNWPSSTITSTELMQTRTK